MAGLQETLVLVKPDGVARNLTGEILLRIESKGYQLVGLRMVEPNRDLLSAHYAEHEGKPQKDGTKESDKESLADSSAARCGTRDGDVAKT